MVFLKLENIFKSYKKGGGGFFFSDKQKVLKNISFEIEEGDCLGLIGESGSGKSTLSRLILGLEDPDNGSIKIEGLSIKNWIKQNKGKMSVVFQDYTSSTNPNFKVFDIINESLIALGNQENSKFKIESLLKQVGLSAEYMYRYPHELSGGQLQRVCIARAIATNPKFIVLDEAISSLDISVQAQILELLLRLKKDLNITYLFITHDLQIVPNICNKIVFLYKGEIIEEMKSKNLSKTKSEYAKKLLGSVISLEKNIKYSTNII